MKTWHKVAAGSCTQPVIGDDGWPAGYCGHDCYEAVHGESPFEAFARHMRGGASDADLPGGNG